MMDINNSLVRCVIYINGVYKNFVETGASLRYEIGDKNVLEESQSVVNSFEFRDNKVTVFTNDGTIYTNDANCYRKYNSRLQKNTQRLLAARLVDTEKKIINIGKFKEFVIIDNQNVQVSKIRANPDYTGKRALNPAFIGKRRAVVVGEGGYALVDGNFGVHTANDLYVIETDDSLICEFDLGQYIEKAKEKQKSIREMFEKDVRETGKPYRYMIDVQKIEKVPSLSVDNEGNFPDGLKYIHKAADSQLAGYRQKTSIDCVEVKDSVLVTCAHTEYAIQNIISVQYSVYGPFVLETEDACYGNFMIEKNHKVKPRKKVIPEKPIK